MPRFGRFSPRIRMRDADAPAGAKEAGDAVAMMDLDEMLVCLAFCGQHKYNAIEQMSTAVRVRGMYENVLRDAAEEEVVKRYTHLHCPRFDAAVS